MKKLFIFSLAAASAFLLRWILEPDYIRPHRRVERKIDTFLQGIIERKG